MTEFEEMLKGLSAEDAIAVVNDCICFGTAMVHEVDGVKRRVAPQDWVNASSAE